MKSTVLLELDKSVYNAILSSGIDIRRYVLEPVKVEMDETEYLTSTKKNKELLDKAVKDIKNKKNLKSIKFEDL
ncbi:MAG: hypothetical protein LBG48_05690 [Rickettsiales bacterium]|jgi:hypothetical protein|nr:hypothetical protein [Rickettsiales bacterium]